MQKEISVKERLPEESVRVLIYNIVFDSWEIACREGNFWELDDGAMLYKDYVSKWMPLPETPEDNKC